MNPSELTGLKFGDYYRLRVYDNNVWAGPGGPVVAEDSGGKLLTMSE